MNAKTHSTPTSASTATPTLKAAMSCQTGSQVVAERSHDARPDAVHVDRDDREHGGDRRADDGRRDETEQHQPRMPAPGRETAAEHDEAGGELAEHAVPMGRIGGRDAAHRSTLAAWAPPGHLWGRMGG